VETILNGLKKNYNEWKIELDHKYKSSKESWGTVVMKLDATLFKRMKNIHRWKSSLLALHRPELIQSSQWRITPTPSTLAEVNSQGHKSKPTEPNKTKEEGGTTPTNKEKEAERRKKADLAAKAAANKKVYTPEEKAAWALKKQEERDAKKPKYGPGGNTYTPEQKAAYALKKKAEQQKKQTH
jgi:hypothetical protein